jgi:hypothetical protein
MKIGLIDVDGHNFPNLALMKISAYHKMREDEVEWAYPMADYDIVYQSKVFDETYSKDIDWMPRALMIKKGGAGYVRKRRNDTEHPCEIFVGGSWKQLREFEFDTPWRAKRVGNEFYFLDLSREIEHIYPDYDLYPELTRNTAYGYLTRGCPRHCDFCGVGEKEGLCSIKVADLTEFWRGQKYIKLLDPNLLCCRERLDLLEQLADSKAYVDFTQGLDIRAVNADVIDLINRIKLKEVHFAWDNPEQDLTTDFGYYAGAAKHKPHGRFGTVYVLTNFGTTMEENLHRIYTLRDLGYDPYVMVYDKPNAPKDIRRLQRWCNNRVIFKSCPDFKDYR